MNNTPGELYCTVCGERMTRDGDPVRYSAYTGAPIFLYKCPKRIKFEECDKELRAFGTDLVAELNMNQAIVYNYKRIGHLAFIEDGLSYEEYERAKSAIIRLEKQIAEKMTRLGGDMKWRDHDEREGY